MSSAPVPLKTISKPALKWPWFLLGGIVATSVYHGYVTGKEQAAEKLQGSIGKKQIGSLAEFDITKAYTNSPRIRFLGGIEVAYLSPFTLLLLSIRNENHRKQLAAEKKKSRKVNSCTRNQYSCLK